MPVNEVVSIIKDLCLAGAAVTTATIAWRGVESWRSELKGKADFEVARGFIRATYQLRDAIEVCRSPWIPVSEFPEGYRSSYGKRDAKEEGQAMAFVYGNRWDKVSTCIQEFDTATLEAEALWGSEIEEKAKNLRRCVSELRSAIESVIRDAYSGGEDFNSDREFSKEVRQIVNSTKPDENPLTLKINAAISDIESKVRPHLSRS